MAQINACEFMIKGYHYTKPTDPSRTDSARLYIDTDVSTEASSDVADGTNIWTAPNSASIAIATKDTNTYQLKLKGIHNFYVKY